MEIGTHWRIERNNKQLDGRLPERKGNESISWFTNRVVNDWNRLGRHVISTESIGSFKKLLDENMDRDDKWDG